LSAKVIKLGCVPYINALPLTYGLDPREVELLCRPPAQLLSLLHGKQVDAALLPIVNYFENPELFLVPDLAIACRGAVKSVNLYFMECRGEYKIRPYNIDDIKTIYLDPESRTSHALLKVLLQQHYGMNLANIDFTSDLSNPKIDAKLLIGDKALAKASPSLDLGEAWFQWQKLPFVFAAWMSLDPKIPLLAKTLQSSHRQGMENIDKIVSQAESALDKSSLKEYFTKNLRYTMGDAELDGIRRFHELSKPIQGYRHELHFKFVS
jgi:chorismate dehydratase